MRESSYLYTFINFKVAYAKRMVNKKTVMSVPATVGRELYPFGKLN